MKSGTRIALGLAGGYVVGRFTKTRWLTLVAAGVASKKIADSLAGRGASMVSASPELSKLAEQGREAAAAMLGSRIEGLTERIHTRTESLRQGGEPEEEQPEAEAPEEEQPEEEQPEEEQPEAEAAEEEQPEEEQPEEQPGREESSQRGEGSPGSRRPESRRRATESRTGRDRRGEAAGRRPAPAGDPGRG
jgi:outer membrane biosynthesis protein TonB